MGSPDQGIATLQVTCVDGGKIIASRDVLMMCSNVFRNAIEASSDAQKSSTIEVPEKSDTMRLALKAAHDIAACGKSPELGVSSPWT